jgi:hypothetical protein
MRWATERGSRRIFQPHDRTLRPLHRLPLVEMFMMEVEHAVVESHGLEWPLYTKLQMEMEMESEPEAMNMDQDEIKKDLLFGHVRRRCSYYISRAFSWHCSEDLR